MAGALLYGLRNPLTVPENIALECDNVAPWLVTIEAPHHQIHEGEMWTWMEVITLANGSGQDYLITVPAGTKAPHFEYQTDGIFGVTLEMFMGTGKTQSASAVTPENRNHNSTNAPTMTIKKGTNGGTGDGTRFVWKSAGSGTSAGKLSSSAGARAERILKTNTAYIFRVTSQANANVINVWFSWYEEGA